MTTIDKEKYSLWSQDVVQPHRHLQIRQTFPCLVQATVTSLWVTSKLPAGSPVPRVTTHLQPTFCDVKLSTAFLCLKSFRLISYWGRPHTAAFTLQPKMLHDLGVRCCSSCVVPTVTGVPGEGRGPWGLMQILGVVSHSGCR